jgi:hypothetical protein
MLLPPGWFSATDLSMIQPENNAKGKNLPALDREEHMRIYLFGQSFMSISSPSSTSGFAITLSIG